MDPNAWAIGPLLPVSHFVVKSAARRKLLLDMQAADPDFSVAYGQRPRLWPCPDGSGGLLALEQRWQALFSNKCVLLLCAAEALAAGSQSRPLLLCLLQR